MVKRLKDEVVSEGWEEGSREGTIGPWRGKDYRDSSHLRGRKDDGAWGFGLLREERTALLVQIVYLNLTEPQGVPSTLSDPLEVCSFSRMLPTVLSALTERDPVSVKASRQKLNTFHYSRWWWSVKITLGFVVKQQYTKLISSRIRWHLTQRGENIYREGRGVVFLQYSSGLSSEAKL